MAALPTQLYLHQISYNTPEKPRGGGGAVAEWGYFHAKHSVQRLWVFLSFWRYKQGWTQGRATLTTLFRANIISFDISILQQWKSLSSYIQRLQHGAAIPISTPFLLNSHTIHVVHVCFHLSQPTPIHWLLWSFSMLPWTKKWPLYAELLALELLRIILMTHMKERWNSKFW